MEQGISTQPTASATETTTVARRGRLHGLDFTRGVACLSMPIYHSVYNLFVVGLVDHQWTKHLFWQIYQHLGLGTFVLVSGMAFTLSTRRRILWSHLARRALRLAVIAAGITLVTYLLMPDRFVRFGVLHFFAVTIVLAPLLRPLGPWLLLPGLAIVATAIMVPKSGIIPEPSLYITGLMSERPRSMDYIPLIPWLGVFMIGMACAHLLKLPDDYVEPRRWMQPIIWLGKHSLAFYLIHQVVVYGILWSIAYLLR